MRSAVRALPALALLFYAGLAHADLVVLERRAPPPGPALVLISVDWRAGASAPEADREAVTSEVRSRLASLSTRVAQCTRGHDMREDPLRSRTRRMTVVFRFSRSTTPRVSVERSNVPAVARSCVLEAARSIRASTAPRGDVAVRAVYELR